MGHALYAGEDVPPTAPGVALTSRTKELTRAPGKRVRESGNGCPSGWRQANDTDNDKSKWTEKDKRSKVEDIFHGWRGEGVNPLDVEGLPHQRSCFNLKKECSEGQVVRLGSVVPHVDAGQGSLTPNAPLEWD